MSGRILVVGLGPGSMDWLAPAAEDALQRVDVILGYQRYLEQIALLRPDIPRESSGMRHEVERARRVIELANQGKIVALVSGGDAGIYAMAGLVLELLEAESTCDIPVEVLPGISALNTAAALLGAPLMTDFAVISLSDYLVPLETILKRLQAAVLGDFVICLYNPRSHQRSEPYDRAYQFLLDELGGERPVGVVQAAYREGQRVICATLKDLPKIEVGMDCVLIVGNSQTRLWNGKMITPRGYAISRTENRL